jgi:hypothetical protein
MSWLITPRIKSLAGTAGIIPESSILGLSVDGGFFGGYISHTANGVPTHALIVAPRATGATGTGYALATTLAWKTEQTTTAGTTSAFDGAANTAAMVAAGIANHPAAEFCVNLNIGGFADWYLPAQLELEIAYSNLKPGTTSNSTNTGSTIYSVPPRTSNYTAENPPQTSILAFQSGQPECFEPQVHYSSTEHSATNALRRTFSTGGITNGAKTNLFVVRAFRRIAF